MQTQLVELPRQTREAEVRAQSYDDEARTVEVVWTTGAKVRRRTWSDGPYDEELIVADGNVRLERLNAGAPLLNAHASWDLAGVIGSVVPGSARIDAGQGIATVRLSSAPEDESIIAKIRDGIIRNISCGYLIHRVEKIEGQEGDVPLWRVVDWEPCEISAVPVPADPGARVRGSGPTPPHPDRLYSCVVIRAGAPAAAAAAPKEKTVEATETRAAVPEGGITQTTTSVPPAPPEAATAEAIRAEAQLAERERVTAITTLAARVNVSVERSFVDQHIASGTSLDAFRAALLDNLAAQSDRNPVNSNVRAGALDETETRRKAAVDALLHRYSPGVYKLTDPAKEFRGMSLLEIAKEFLEARGVNVRGMSRQEVAQRSFLTTSDFPFVLEAVTNKTLRAAYDAYPQTFRPFCRAATAADFKAINRVQLGEVPQLQRVNESGEFKRGAIAEGKESYRIYTDGVVVSLSRQAIINDDLNAFTTIPAKFGTAVATRESDIVWEIITGNPAMADGVALFHTATHKNLAGSGTALSVATIGAARTEMAKQKGLDGKTKLNIRPAFVLVPSELELTAEQMLTSSLVAAKVSDTVPNSIRSLTPIAEPRLSDNSATAWYLVASPSQIDTIEYAYLDGQVGPYIETRMGFDVDGMEIKCRIDFGAKAIDWRGLYKNPGA